MKKVSIIIPLYCAEKYIADTIQSALAQTYQNFEIIIVDNGSTDRSVEVCQQFTDPRIKIIRQENRGAAGSRNTGIRHAQGEYLAFLDADDLWLREKLEKQVEHLNNSPAVGISYCWSAFIDEDGNRLGIHQKPKLKGITQRHVLCRNPISNGSTPLFRREVFDGIKFQDNLYGTVEDFYFDEQLYRSEDIECWLRMAIQTDWQMEGLPEMLTLYRVNSTGISANLYKQLESHKQILDKIRSYAPELLARWENLSMAYQFRYLARRAVTLKDGAAAIDMFNRSIVTDCRILFEEPRKTLITGGAAYLLWLIPPSLYHHIENIALRLTGKTQPHRLRKEQSQPFTQVTSPEGTPP